MTSLTKAAGLAFTLQYLSAMMMQEAPAIDILTASNRNRVDELVELLVDLDAILAKACFLTAPRHGDLMVWFGNTTSSTGLMSSTVLDIYDSLAVNRNLQRATP